MTTLPPNPEQTSTNNAPWLSIPEGSAISVEHPCLVKNVDRAIDMIGGGPAISQALDQDLNRTFALSFHPDDPAARTIIANKKEANNVLLQVSIPRRTGRKRKRGSNDSWTEDLTGSPPKKDVNYMIRSMADNVGRYNVTALSAISSMHIWRSMPDFAYSTSQLKLLNDVKSKLLSQHYPTVKEFNLPRTYGLEDTTTFPPPMWSNQSIPQNYTYRQNPSIKVINDPSTGQRILKNTQAAPKIYSYQMQWDSPEYPTAPMKELSPLAEHPPTFQQTVAALRTLFQDRPIWTRRALLNRLDSDLSSFNVVRFCLAYVAYALRSGPWRDTYVRLGVDPRKDPQCRFYQSIMLQLVPHTNQAGLGPKANAKRPLKKQKDNDDTEEHDATPGKATKQAKPDKAQLLESRDIYARFWSRSNDVTSHIFDGVKPLPPDGKIWQLCDIVDPQLAALRDIADLHIRPFCETRYFGWYYNGTNAKMRVCLKAKTEALQAGTVLDPSTLEGFLSLPERVGFEQIGTSADGEATLATNKEQATQADISQQASMQKTPVVGAQTIGVHNEALSVYLGESATKQQLEWAALYRAFARTEPGQKPAAGGHGHGRLTKSKPVYRRSYRGKRDQDPSTAQKKRNRAKVQDAVGTNQEQPIDVDATDQDQAGIYDEGPELQEGEEVMPSIEHNGYDIDEGDDYELGLDGDLEIKLEEDQESRFIRPQSFQGVIDPDLERTLDDNEIDGLGRV